jgi:riboflavin kinase/FMN adenylyltransferase
VDVIRHITTCPRRFDAPVLTLGNFDGVHRGHQAIFARVVADARARGGAAMAITFTPHPMAVLRPEKAPPALTSLRDKLALLDETGIDVLILKRFTPEFAAVTAPEFVERFIVGAVGAAKLVVGHSVSFGRDRAGNAPLLQELGARFGFDVEVIGPVEVDGHEVSSSAIRRAVAAGDVRLAAKLLGRPHRLTGRIVVGKRRGAALGFPTANVAVRAGMFPPDGVYAVTTEIDGVRRPGVANIGRNPTFGPNAPRTLEAHIFDFDGDVYGRRCRVGFVERLRGETKFDSVDALVVQIRADAEQARAILASQPS